MGRLERAGQLLTAAIIVGAVGMACTKQQTSQAAEAGTAVIDKAAAQPDDTQPPATPTAWLIVKADPTRPLDKQPTKQGARIVIKNTPRPTATLAEGEEIVPINLNTNSSKDPKRFIPLNETNRTTSITSLNTPFLPTPTSVIIKKSTATPQPAFVPTESTPETVRITQQSRLFDNEGKMLYDLSEVRKYMRRYAEDFSAIQIGNGLIAIKENTPEEKKFIDFLINAVGFVNSIDYKTELNGPEKDFLQEVEENTLFVNDATGKIVINTQSKIWTKDGIQEFPFFVRGNPEGYQARTLIGLLYTAYPYSTSVYQRIIKAKG